MIFTKCKIEADHEEQQYILAVLDSMKEDPERPLMNINSQWLWNIEDARTR